MSFLSLDSFSTRSTLVVNGRNFEIYRLSKLEKIFKVSELPCTLKIFLENMLRHEDGLFIKAEDIQAFATRRPGDRTGRVVYFMPTPIRDGLDAECGYASFNHLAKIVLTRDENERTFAFPEILVDTDPRAPMANSLGVLGWRGSETEAHASRIERPWSMILPEVVGFKLTGRLPARATTGDAAITVARMLKQKGTAGMFVEFYGPGLSSLGLRERNAISNQCQEYGAATGFFPVDDRTLEHLKLTGRPPERLSLIEAYCKAQGLFYSANAPEPEFSTYAQLNLDSVEPFMNRQRLPQTSAAFVP